MCIETIKDIFLILGSVGTFIAIGKGVLEYSKNNRVKRAEHFSDMHSEMHHMLTVTKMGELLDSNSPDIIKVDNHDRLRFLGFYEKVALMLNSGLISENVAYYMFGYYAIQCYDNAYFWQKVNKDSSFWSLFVEFAKRMKQVELKNNVPALIRENKLIF
jgi:hypothetical protein